MTQATFALFLKATAEEHLRRMNSRLRGAGKEISLSLESGETNDNHYLRFRTADEAATIVIPRTRQNQFGNWVIGDRNDRALCPFMLVLEGKPRYVTYEQFVAILLAANIEELFPEQGRKNHLDKILWAFANKRGRLAVSLCQRFLNQSLFNALPLSGTPMQDWAMNRRLMIFDPIFGKLRPEEKLAYQKRKNELLYPWSSIGLSDGAAAVNNYILQAHLPQYTAFGRHHNPMRNLYSTLGMKGEEAPWVVSESAASLEESGVSRGGWNWMTVFLDLPLNFEDQILVSRRHAGKTVSYERSFTVFGEESVSPGDHILKDAVLGTNEDGSPVVFNIDCDHAEVVGCKDSVVPFDGNEQPVRIVTLKVVYCFKEGIKITNQHGNKGIVILEDLGTVHDPVRGEIPIDVIVSAKSIQKRKNFGQVLEALATKIRGPGERIVIPDNAEVTQEQVEKKLTQSGHNPDGTSVASTPWGKFDSLAGWVHWGVIKTPEEQLWEKDDVTAVNQRGLRIRGNKVSTIELKSLTTLFGPGSHVVKEILSYRQGTEEVREYLETLRVITGSQEANLPVVSPDSFVYLPAGLGTFHTQEQLVGTLSDELLYPHGCYLQLPFRLMVAIPDERSKNIVEGLARQNAYDQFGAQAKFFEFDTLLIPSFPLRQPWQHPTGKLGLSEITTQLNQLLEALDRLKHGEIKEEQASALVFKYLHFISKSLSFKTGKISTYLMAVRYPWSSKATAVLGRNLEPNWIEIHQDMARDLRIGTGDYVLVERFPCLGFMSTRIQRARVTDDPECKYVIRVSGNSLVSMNLDFDGDVIYLMSFHTEGAKAELERNFLEPHPRIREVIEQLNSRKQPLTRAMNLQELELRSFPVLTPKEHAELNGTSLAVKLYTGPVIALCYNLMRVAEANFSYHDRESHINIEVLLDKVGNSVFSQKHGVRSLREECIEAVCLADAKAMVALGFPERESTQLCQTIRKYAAQLGIRTDEGLRAHYQRHVEEGRSSIINTIVRRFHKAYFATRSNLHPVQLLEHLNSEPRDLVSYLIREGLSTKKA